MQAVTGRRLPRNDNAINQAMASRLPALYAAKQDRAWDEKVFEAEQDWKKRDEALARESLETAKKQSKKANLINLANVGASAWMAHSQNNALKEALNADDGEVIETPSEFIKAGISSSGNSVPFFSREGAGSLGNWTGALKDHYLAIPGGVLTGMTLGKQLGKEYIPFGGEKEKEMMGSALVSGGTTYLASGGDIYSTVASAVIGGAMGASGAGDYFSW